MIFFPRLKSAQRAIFRAPGVFLEPGASSIWMPAASGRKVDRKISRYAARPVSSFGIH